MKKKDTLVDFIEWDVVNWSKALTFWERNVDFKNKNSNCLELGGRRGGLSLWLAKKGNEVICSDLENPEQQAREILNKHSYEGKIKYEAIDATAIPYENCFDIVIFKSILGGISRSGRDSMKQVVIDQIFKSLKPGGKLLFAENLEASAFHRFLRRRLVRWGASWNYLKIDDVEGLFQEFNSLQFETAGFLGAFGVSDTQRNFFGGLDTVLFDKIVTNRMKYIIFGVATK